jgi:catechol-2,3-dioxygenase
VNTPSITISHIGLKCVDLLKMKDFYIRVIGLTKTDEEADRMAFFSGDPSDHHQLFLVPGRKPEEVETRLAHVAFRVPDLTALREAGARLKAEPEVSDLHEVTHGNAWSLYFKDPEGNTVEVFVDTPWHVAQPFRKLAKILDASDEELAAWTDQLLDGSSTKKPFEAWREEMSVKMKDR